MTATRARSDRDSWVFLLPPGWARFPAGQERREQLDEAIDAVLARALPDDMPIDAAGPARRMLRERLRATIGEADEIDANAVYLPIAPIEGVFVPASIVETELVSDPGADPALVAASVVADDWDESAPVEIDGSPGVRVAVDRERVERAGDWPVVSTRQIVYLLSREPDAGAWLALSFEVVWGSPESQRLAAALELFFDAVMTTFRWVGGDAGDDLPATPGVPGSAPPA